MFKGSKVAYEGSRKVNEGIEFEWETRNNWRYMNITIKAESNEEASFLFDNLMEYLEKNASFEFIITQCPENDNNEYYDTIAVEDKAEYDELKDLYMVWKKSAKAIVMPVEEVETIKTEYSEPTITEAPVCEKESVEVTTIEATESITPEINNANSSIIEQGNSATNFKNIEIKNSNAIITDNNIQTGEISKIENDKVTITESTKSLPTYIIHTEPVNDPYGIGRLIRIDLYNNMTITDILELQNYVLEQYQEGYTDSNGQRQVTYWRIVKIKNTDSTITEQVISCHDFVALEIDHNSYTVYNNFEGVNLIMYKKEDFKFLNMKTSTKFLGKEEIFSIENQLTVEEKIKFIDEVANGIATYLLNILNKWEAEKDSLPKDKLDSIKTVSKKAWIKRNDHKKIIDVDYNAGKYYLFGTVYKTMSLICPTTEYGYSNLLYTDDNIVNQWFHDLCVKLKNEENKYFNNINATIE